jgi:hypothetical protein
MTMKPRITTGLFIGTAVAFSACTSIHVDPVSPTIHMKHVCVQHNPDVGVCDFVPVVRDAFDRHGISTELVVLGAIPDRCDDILTYVAIRGGILELMYHAELRLEHQGRRIEYAEYHLPAKGHWSPSIHKSTRAQMDPAIDELLRAPGGSR